MMMKEDSMMLETKRLILRTPVMQDAQAYLALRNSEFVLRYNAMSQQTLEQAQNYLAEENSEEQKLILLQKDTEKVIGMVFITEDSLRWDVSSKEISYFLAESYARQGYMTEALTAVIRYLFDSGEVSCITARSFVPNTASRRLLSGLGFQQEGTLRRCVRGYKDVVFDDAVYSLMKEEWI